MGMTIRVGLIGAGFIGHKHAAAYISQRQFGSDIMVELKAVCDANEATAKALMEDYGFERIETDWHKIVSADDIDLVCICTPNNMHCEIAMEAARNGKAINCEKPLGMDGHQSEQAAKTIEKYGVIATCSYNTVKVPVIAYVKKVIGSGRLGRFVSFRGSYDTDRLASSDAPHEWRMLTKYSRIGALGDLALNILAISQYLIGDITEVCGMMSLVYDKRMNAEGIMLPVENEDVAQFLCKYANGGIGYISSNRVAAGCKQTCTFEAQFTKGTIRFSIERMNEIDIYYSDDSAEDCGFKKIIAAPEHGSYGKIWSSPGMGLGFEELKIIEEHDLLENIAYGTKPEVDFVFAAKIDCVLEAVVESAKRKVWMKVKTLDI